MRRSRLLSFLCSAVAASVSLACADANGPSDPAFKRGPVGDLLEDVTGFLSCQAQPEKADTFTVGSRGGDFKVGFARLKVPKNAIAPGMTRTFEMRTPSATINSVIFTPLDRAERITFLTPVKLSVDFKNCEHSHGKPKLTYTTDENDPETGLPNVLADVTVGIDLLGGSVEGETSHFSRYAVHY